MMRLPATILEHTDDQFVIAFLNSRDKDPNLSPSEFLRPFESLADTLTHRWNISLEDRAEDEVLAATDGAPDVCRIIDEEAQNIRGWGKSQAVQAHDACHYELVKHERGAGRNAWFLTRDRTLVGAAARLARKDEPHFCFSLVGFLHSISPFVTTPEQEDSFVSVLSRLITDQVFAVGPIFDAGELALLGEFHEDVMATPAEQLLLALDYVKSKTLEGRPYRSTDIPKVSLELRKFLSSSKDEQYRTLEAERARLAALAERETQRRKGAERQAITLEETGAVQARRLTQAESDARSSEKQAYKARVRLRALLMLIGLVIAVALWRNCRAIVTAIALKFPTILELMSLETATEIISGFGVLVAVVGTLAFVASLRIPREVQVASLVLVGALILGLSRILNEVQLSLWANCLGVAAPLVAIIVAILWPKSKQPD